MERIVQIGAYPIDPNKVFGGVEASVFGLAQAQSAVAEVHVFDSPRMSGVCGIEQFGRVVAHRFNNPSQRQLATVSQVKEIAEEIVSLHPDVCHIHGTGAFSWLMYRALSRKRMNVVVTVHGLARVEKRNALRKSFTLKRLGQYIYQSWVERRFLSNVPMAIVDTDYVRDMVVRYPLRNTPKMHVVPQGIDEEYFGMNCSAESKVFLSVGSIGERKGHLYTLRAFELLRKGGVEAELVIAGVISNSSYYDRLKTAIENSEFAREIKLYVDLTNDKIKDLYQKAHVFTLHSEEESQGIVFAEAMATGLPVVATKVGGVPYVVRDGETGLLSDYADITTFADNMKRLMTDVQLWRTMTTAAKNKAEVFHWGEIALRVSDVYNLNALEMCADES